MNSCAAPRQTTGCESVRARGHGPTARLIEGVEAGGVDSVAEAGDGAVVCDGDLLGARGGEAGGVAAAEVVHEGGVGPEGLHGGVAVVGALQEEWVSTALLELRKKISHKYSRTGLLHDTRFMRSCRR
jgi:hypothetical protein